MGTWHPQATPRSSGALASKDFSLLAHAEVVALLPGPQAVLKEKKASELKSQEVPASRQSCQCAVSSDVAVTWLVDMQGLLIRLDGGLHVTCLHNLYILVGHREANEDGISRLAVLPQLAQDV